MYIYGSSNLSQVENSLKLM